MKKRWSALVLALLMAVSLVPAASAASTASVQIPDTAVEFNGHYYQYYTKSLSWENAQAACEALGGHLVTITSQEEQTFLENYLSYKNNSDLRGKYLIGLHRQITGFDTWVTGEPVTYTNWGEMEPDNLGNRQDMVIFNNGGTIGYGNGSYKIEFGQWDDDTNSSYRYICEWDTKPAWSNASNWSTPDLQRAQEMDLIPAILYNTDLTKSINRQEFAAVCVKVYENLSGTKALPAVTNPFVDCKDLEVLKAYNVGITNGVDMANGLFAPYEYLNREQAATMLTRTFKRVTMPGWTLETDSQFTLPYTMPTPFRDDQTISAYARDSVYFMAANNIILGFEDSTFRPQNITDKDAAVGYANATREQALIIAVRMVDNLK